MRLFVREVILGLTLFLKEGLVGVMHAWVLLCMCILWRDAGHEVGQVRRRY